MVAVKTNRQLRTKSNVSLACLATTDLPKSFTIALCSKVTLAEFVAGNSR